MYYADTILMIRYLPFLAPKKKRTLDELTDSLISSQDKKLKEYKSDNRKRLEQLKKEILDKK